MLVPTGTGEPRTIALEGVSSGLDPGFLPDAQGFVFVARDRENRGRLFLQKLAGGPPALLLDRDLDTNPCSSLTPVSPDGRWAAVYAADGTLLIADLQNGSARPLSPGEPGLGALRFVADGRSLILMRVGTPPGALLRCDATDGATTLLHELSPPDLAGVTLIASAVATPDQRAYAYTFIRQMSELYLIQGLK